MRDMMSKAQSALHLFSLYCNMCGERTPVAWRLAAVRGASPRLRLLRTVWRAHPLRVPVWPGERERCLESATLAVHVVRGSWAVCGILQYIHSRTAVSRT